ncbi:MAG: helix-turn-helix domain-containing protein [Kiloniellales bacterium]
MTLSRPPKAALRPFVELLWASDGTEVSPSRSDRELVLPTGALHVVFRLRERPLRVFKDGDDALGDLVGCAVIGGARAGPYLRDVSQPAPSVGALLRPGAAASIVGAPVATFSNAHTRLDDVWGAAPVAEIGDRLNEASSAAARLEIFEAALAARLPRLKGIEPLVAYALTRFGAARQVGAVVKECGYSHRHFTEVFSEAVGLAPKTYCRVLRFGRALERLTAEPGISWADLAVAEGYADQPHFTREFRAMAGLSPGSYRRLAPRAPRHVPL